MLLEAQAPEILISGPAGTGKSLACLHKLHLVLSTVSGARALVVRKTLASLTSTGLVTFREKVLHPLDGVHFFAGSKDRPAQYQYPNGSALVVGGLDKSQKIMSSEYDLIFVQEATDLALDDWEKLSTRLRHWVLPYQQQLGDCNPDRPTHWLKVRSDQGRTRLLESRHEDNPELVDDLGQVTAQGAEYLSKLDALTGVRLLRLRKGIWAAAEGLVYDGWDPALHLVDRFPITKDNPQGDPPRDWPRYWAVDFGYTHPFAWGAWAEDPDGRLYLYRQIHRTQRIVEDHAETILAATASEPRPVAIVCDHDAEDRATLERKLRLPTVPAYKRVSPGLQAVAERLRLAGDGRPRLFVLRDSLVDLDRERADAGKAISLETEMEGYVWDVRMGQAKGEAPVKDADDAEDMARYVVAFVDNLALDPSDVQGVAVHEDLVSISPF